MYNFIGYILSISLEDEACLKAQLFQRPTSSWIHPMDINVTTSMVLVKYKRISALYCDISAVGFGISGAVQIRLNSN